MHLDRRFAFVVGCSLLWALVVAGLFYRVAANNSGQAKAPPTKTLVVAAEPLPLGAVIHAESVKTTQVPESLFPKGGFSRKEDVLDRPVVSPIEPDEAVVEARIAARGSGIGLAPMIPPGMRAISVRVNDVAGVAGFVLPGMRVDVLVTGRPPDQSDTYTTTVLQNIPVLSAGQTIQADAKGQPISAAVVTLLVSPSQAESLTLANSEGHLQLVLRNSTDQQAARTPGRELRQLLHIGESRSAAVPVAVAGRPRRTSPSSSPGPTAPVMQRAVVAAEPPEEVVVIRGSQKTIEPARPKTAN